MLRTIISRFVSAAERDYAVDMSYVRFLVDTDPAAFLRFARIARLLKYRGVPDAVWFAVGIVGTRDADCGPCTQLGVIMAERAGVDAATLRAVLRSDDDALEPDVRLGVEYARAALAHASDAEALREQVLKRWGRRGLVSIAFALAGSRVFPTLKYALGYGRACTRIVIHGEAVTPCDRQAARLGVAPRTAT